MATGVPKVQSPKLRSAASPGSGWYVRVTVAKKRKDFYRKSEAAAFEFWAEIRADQAQGVLWCNERMAPLKEELVAATADTFVQAAFSYYHERQEDWSPSNRESTASHLIRGVMTFARHPARMKKAKLMDSFAPGGSLAPMAINASLELSALTEAHLDEFLDKATMRADGKGTVSKSTFTRRVKAVNSFLNTVVGQTELSHNALGKRSKHKLRTGKNVRLNPKRSKRAPTFDEFWQVRDHIAQDHPHFVRVFDIMVHTSARPSEAVGLCYGDVDWRQGELVFRQPVTIGGSRWSDGDGASSIRPRLKHREIGEERQVYTSDALFECLCEQRDFLGYDETTLATAWLFPARGSMGTKVPIGRNWVSEVWRNAWRDVIGPDVVPVKKIRSLNITEQVQQGVDVATIAANSGNSEEVIMRHYLATRSDDVQARVLDSIVPPKRDQFEQTVLEYEL